MSKQGAAAPDADADLAQRAGHDRRAFAELYRRYLPQVYRYLLARTANVQDAQDLASQTFLTALEQIVTFRGDGTVAAWLLSVARHKLADHYRRRKPLLELEAAMEVPDGAALPEDQALQRWKLQRVGLALQALAPDRAEALALRIFGRLTVPEIAHIMDRSEAAVRMLVHRGLRDLQDRMAPEMEEVDVE